MKATENTNIPRIRIYTDEREAPKGDLFGIFFEDINYSADGGVYPEMLQNGSFEMCIRDRDARRRGGPARMTAEKPARSRVLQRGMNKKSA